MTRQTVLSLRAPLFKNDSLRRIDRVIDYFGDARPPIPRDARESAGDLAASERWTAMTDE